MPLRLPTALLFILLFGFGSAFAADEGFPIIFRIPPAEVSDGQPLPPSIPLSPLPPTFPSRLEMPSLAPSLFSYPVLESPYTGPKEFVFKEYWAEVEKEYGIDDLRGRMGKLNTDSRTPSALMPGTGNSGLNLLALGIHLHRAWQIHEDKAVTERRFHLRLHGVIELANRLEEDRQAASPGISLIVAKLDFMGKRVKGRLPNRPDRRRFTEDLKAWAANPVFDSTGLGPALMEVCRLYEEFEP